METWNKSSEKLPPDNTLVRVKHNQDEFNAYYYMGRWWDEDKQIYFYYTPQEWKFIK